MILGLTPQQTAFFAILVLSFALLVTEKIRNDVVAVLIILALALTGVLEPREALSGFSGEPAIVVAAIFVLSGALHHTGLSETIGQWIGRLAGRGFTRAVAVIMPSVAVLSAFTHHLTTTAVMLPVTLNLSRERGIAPSRLLMPLSFAASLGTTITIIGAPAFLIADGILQRAGRPGLDIFSIAPIGLALSVVGTVFILLVGRFLLPERGGGEETGERFRLDNYFTEITVLSDSPLLGKTVPQIEEDGRYDLRVMAWLRGSRTMLRRDQPVQAGDVLLVRTSPEEMVAIRRDRGVELQPIDSYAEAEGEEGEGGEGGEDESSQFVQTVVAPDSELVGRTLADIDFRRRWGALVVGLWRRDAWLQQTLATIRLRPGDVLVLHGDEEALARVAADRSFLMMMPFHAELRPRGKASLAGLIMLATVVLAATNLLPIDMAAMAGAAAMVLTRCISATQAYRAIDARIFVFIAGALPLGTAMQESGASKLLADWLSALVGGWDETLVLLAIFFLVGALTQIMSDAATTALFGPVAVALAQALGQPPEPYVVTVAMAAVASFFTPIGHHGNLLVYGPGRYRFVDFVKVGTPLTVLVALVVVFLAPLVFPG